MRRRIEVLLTIAARSFLNERNSAQRDYATTVQEMVLKSGIGKVSKGER